MSEVVAITNVKVFDGNALSDERTVVIEHGIISSATTADTTVDGRHGTLLPGFMDSHVHLTSVADLEQGTRWGCTTMLDMGCQSMAVTDSLRHRPGLADIRGAGILASAPGSAPTVVMGYPPSSVVTGPADAHRYVAERVADGVDYIKVAVEDPRIGGAAAFDVATIAALVEEAHKVGLKVIAHATSIVAFKNASDAGVDVLTHAPTDVDVDDHLAHSIRAKGMVCVPTLVTMYDVVNIAEMTARTKSRGLDVDYSHARSSVSTLHLVGVPIIAGTDAYQGSARPSSVQYGKALHEELVLLTEAGLTPVEALRSATVLPAEFFGFTDRGVVMPGYRADLLLIDGDPTQDITATQAIRGVWIAGERVR